MLLGEKMEMEKRRLRKDIEALLASYIGRKLREKGFDPKGKESSTMLDDLAHYDLAISVALWWLARGEGQDLMDLDTVVSSSVDHQYPNHLEREAMILSSFAGLVLNSLPVRDILAMYSCKPSASYPHQHTKSAIVHPFSLSYHPFAMLGSYRAVDHSRKHTQTLKRWLSQKTKARVAAGRKTSASSSSSSSASHSYFSDSSESLKEQTEHYDGSKDSQEN